MDLTHLVQKFWQIVPFSLDKELIDNIVSGFKKLINEPVEIKKLWQVHKKGLIKPDHGLHFKNGIRINLLTGKEELQDKKCFFHFWSDLIKLFVENRVPKIKEHMEFLYNCYRLHTQLRIHAELVLEKLDKMLPKHQIWKQYEKLDRTLRNLLRILYYPELTALEQYYQAHPHIDRCCLTTAVWDSKPGLILLNTNGDSVITEEIPYTTSLDQVLLFFGTKAHIQTKGELEAKPHLVKTDDLSERISIVFFSHILGDEQKVSDIVDYRSELLTEAYKQKHPK
jgi:isopenicillin N synthase-like dioxygenase